MYQIKWSDPLPSYCGDSIQEIEVERVNFFLLPITVSQCESKLSSEYSRYCGDLAALDICIYNSMVQRGSVRNCSIVQTDFIFSRDINRHNLAKDVRFFMYKKQNGSQKESFIYFQLLKMFVFLCHKYKNKLYNTIKFFNDLYL